MTEIKTTGQFRSLLIEMIVAIKDDDTNHSNRANDAAILATKVNDSLACEARVMDIQRNLGIEYSEFGDLPIGGK